MFRDTLPFIIAYVEELAQALKHYRPHRDVSDGQKKWFRYCLMGIVLTNTVCWAAFERVGLGGYHPSALSWMFRHSGVPWRWLLPASVFLVLTRLGINSGSLDVDDTDHRRAKRTHVIHAAHKVYDKKTGGYFNGQSLVFLLLVTRLATIPVGFRFYRPDPNYQAWKKADERLKKQGVKKAQRPKPPARDPNYPDKAELALALLAEFRQFFPAFSVQSIHADALFGTQAFMDRASSLYGGVQTMSQLRSNQKIWFRGREWPLEAYFKAYPGVATTLVVRGGKPQPVTYGAARLAVCAHDRKKRFVVALKYEGETDYRFLVATDLSWRALDIVQAHTLRWLIEVFFEDWKLNEGWAQLAKQPNEDGSSRGLILSLLLDHALILHPEQQARLENKAPACTVGSLLRLSRAEAFLECVRSVLTADHPAEELEKLVDKVAQLFPLEESKKHMSGRDLGRLEPTPSLKYRAAQALCG